MSAAASLQSFSGFGALWSPDIFRYLWISFGILGSRFLFRQLLSVRFPLALQVSFERFSICHLLLIWALSFARARRIFPSRFTFFRGSSVPVPSAQARRLLDKLSSDLRDKRPRYSSSSPSSSSSSSCTWQKLFLLPSELDSWTAATGAGGPAVALRPTGWGGAGSGAVGSAILR